MAGWRRVDDLLGTVLGTAGKGVVQVLDDAGKLRIGWDACRDALDGIEDRRAVAASKSTADVVSGKVKHVVEEIDGDVAGGRSWAVAPGAEKGGGWEVVLGCDGVDGGLGRLNDVEWRGEARHGLACEVEGGGTVGEGGERGQAVERAL